MSLLSLQALVAEFSAGTCSVGELSAQLNVMPTPHKFSRQDKTMEPSDLSRFGLTCAVLTEDRGEALLTWYLAGSRARTSVRREPALALRENEAAYGQKWLGLFAKFDPALCLWRTAQFSLLEDSDRYSQIWPRSGLMRDGMCFQQPTLAPTTFESASGLLPTPTKSWAQRGPGLSNNLDNLRMSLGVTQTCLRIVNLVGWRWPPSFVEWMMGWPSQWTALRPLETAKFREWQQQHSIFSAAEHEEAIHA